ncbi:MAG: single-stranded-DNA-specific exonuclease RecJ [Rhodospirillales bacterium]|nr:single-stranded-DNA-specific exonuclease RecJ [Alphaproteobacteria bacterium]MCB9987678.1 single-stranded-DNA-specific exonuclease RecJ [Rhodospirillales bacterium]USO08022.1 MAG: single-stranded-DNA-specific exonuclease RecJ [Rhodospirillales bacterium]
MSALPEPVLAHSYFMDTPSFKGRLWRRPEYDRAAATRMAQAHGLPEMVAALLTARGVPQAGVEAFLTPGMKDFPDPSLLAGMDAAASEVAAAIMAGRRIGILADFDVDGATSTGILTRFLRSAGAGEAPLYIPDRLSEGYGPNNKAFEWLKEQGCDWVLIADSGITAFDPIQHAVDLNLKTVVLDHHEAESRLPLATHIINPKRADDTSGFTMLAACGVAFLFCVALNRALRAAGHYKNGRVEPDLRQWLDLVALGTVCDMVPMTGPNRLFVKAGFARMARRENAGIDALLSVGKINAVPDPGHAGFVLGPRINAGSRVHHSDLGARLLATEDREEAMRLAWLLDDCNVKRRAMQKDMVAHAAARVSAFGYDGDPVIVLEDPEWHPGLVGLVAGDIKERFGRPACVIGFADAADGGREGRGSGRSVAGINIAEALIAARNDGVLVKGGGHAMAGGFTVLPDRIKDFRDYMKAHIGRQAQSLPPHPESAVDLVMNVRGLTIDLARLVHGAMAPYGSGYVEPAFVLSDVMVVHADIVGGSHVRCTLRDRDGGPTIKAVAFRAVDTPLGRFLLKDARDCAVPVHLLGQVQINSWQGRESAEFHISDGCTGYV